ncbi:NifU family protein [Roseibium marinum]|uniref:Fe-S cluster biogenesis protein NfuA n=1 Tax=Roseibium marinum TaxID=281252 RepID=A0A2S3V1J7_9HYPH|nr:NifU family protein [Roseibium marinum]POF33851.1 Fe-S cluster biogenesis protein NfuA [Roseibium marinum]
MRAETATTLEQPHPSAAEEKRLQVITKVLEEIRPNLQRDGGDCQLVKVEDKKVMVRLTGACVMCKLSSMTLEGIQSRLVEELGELVRVIPVMGGVSA